MTERDDERSFESLRDELEVIVGRLERGDIALDEAIALWQRGEALYRLCTARLESARGSIERLAGAAAEEPLDG
jgi:exodeoxyribonuclease VII small subunit